MSRHRRSQAAQAVRAGLALIAASALLSEPSRAQDAPALAGNPCFSVIEARQDVLPAAPILIDRCTGETFVLVRAKSRPGGYEWAPLAKSATRSDSPAPLAAAHKPTPGKTGCFSYNGRTYCP